MRAYNISKGFINKNRVSFTRKDTRKKNDKSTSSDQPAAFAAFRPWRSSQGSAYALLSGAKLRNLIEKASFFFKKNEEYSAMIANLIKMKYLRAHIFYIKNGNSLFFDHSAQNIALCEKIIAYLAIFLSYSK